MKWTDCNSCGEEFRVISDSGAVIAYCPFCGDEVSDEDLDEELDEDYE